MAETTGQRIKELRKKYKITQDQLAESIGANRVTVANYESGKYNPSSEALLKISEALKVSTDFLLGNDNQANSIPSDNDIKFALFGDPHNITDEQFEEVKQFAQFIRERDKRVK